MNKFFCRLCSLQKWEYRSLPVVRVRIRNRTCSQIGHRNSVDERFSVCLQLAIKKGLKKSPLKWFLFLYIFFNL